MQRVQLVFLALGLAGLILLVRHVGVVPLADALRSLSWWLPVLALFPAALIVVCESLAWRYAFPRDRVTLARLTAVRLAGEAFNHTTPTANVGGDAVKALLLRPRLRVAETLPSLVIGKTSDVVAQALFAVPASVVAATMLGGASVVVQAMIALAIVESALAAAFLLVQLRGTVARGGDLIARLGLSSLGRTRFAAFRLDRALAGYYRRRRRRFALSVVWFVAALLVAVLETSLLLALLDGTTSTAVAFAATAAVAAATFASFLVPGDVGVHEGAWVLVLGAFGVAADDALAVATVKRVRELVWVGIGYACWLALSGAAGRGAQRAGSGDAPRAAARLLDRAPTE
ncbi:MAG: lysylphosphatidylglycerol synthase domain-containing protein [Thermodesulfobacteriota bacterium]